MAVNRNKKQNFAQFEKIREEKNKKNGTRSISKFNMKKAEEGCVRDGKSAKFDSRCKSWRLIVRNLPFKVSGLNFSFGSASLIVD